MKRLFAALLAASLLGGCASIPEPRVLGEVDAVRRSASVAEARRLAPTSVARADLLADEARRVLDQDDAGADAAAQHLAENALAAYETARATARNVVAERRRDAAGKQRDEAAGELVGLEGELGRQSGDVVALERDLAVLTELELPRASGAASAEREAARRVAGRSLSLDARLLCASARLLAPLLGADVTTIDAAAAEAAAVDEALSAPGPTPIDRAARIRARCLEELTRVRRQATRTGAATGAVRIEASADALLAALSAAALEPSRDERGVIVVVRDAFEGERLSTRGAKQLADLDRVAAAHPDFPVLVVVHDDKAGKGAEQSGRARAQSAASALPAAASRVRGEWAGTSAPIAAPKGAASARNARLEVVFVAPSSI